MNRAVATIKVTVHQFSISQIDNTGNSFIYLIQTKTNQTQFVYLKSMDIAYMSNYAYIKRDP